MGGLTVFAVRLLGIPVSEPNLTSLLVRVEEEPDKLLAPCCH